MGREEDMKNVIGIVVSYLFIFCIMLIAKLFEKMGKETSRKFIHIMLSNWWFIAMYFFDHWAFAAFVPATFVLINFISYKKNLIGVMERERSEEEGLGTVYYAITLLVLAIITFAIQKPELGLIPVLIMGYGDGLAAVIGNTIKSKQYKVGKATKSVAGSVTMFLVSLVILLCCLGVLGISYWYIKAFVLAIILTILEGVAGKGTDNLLVPLSCFIMLLLVG